MPINLSPHSDELVRYLIQAFSLTGENKLEIRWYKNMSRLGFLTISLLQRHKTEMHDVMWKLWVQQN